MNSTSPQYFIILPSILGGLDMVLIVIGLFGNNVIIFVTFNRKIRIFTKVFLISEAICDNFTLCLLGFPEFISNLNISNGEIFHKTNCAIRLFFIYILTDISRWNLVVLSLERFLLLRFPLNSKIKNLNKRHAFLTIFILTCIGIFKNFFILTTTVILVEHFCMFLNRKAYLIFMYIDTTFTLVIPFLFILFNTVGCLILIRQQSLRVSTNGQNSPSQDSGLQILRMILAISIYNFISSIPLYVILSVKRSYINSKFNGIINMLYDISYLFYLSNNSLKCYLYILSSISFRKMFSEFFTQTIYKKIFRLKK